MADLEYETDSVVTRTERVSLDGSMPYQRYQVPSPKEIRSIGVQTTEIAKAFHPREYFSEFEKPDGAVLVNRQQLETMRRYYLAVKNAYFNYSATDGNSAEIIKKLFEQTPEILNANRQGLNPIESALSQRRWTAAAQLIDLAARRNRRALWHRTSSGDDVLMLAVAGGGESVVKQLLVLHCGQYACMHYNASGRNALHLCALGSSDTVLELILDSLADLLARKKLTQDAVTAALCTSDCDGSSPLHYMARDNQVGMLKAVHEFSQCHHLLFDWDLRQTAGDCLTPLAVAAKAEAVEACRFLLNHGLVGIDLHDHIDVWLQVPLSDSIRPLLSEHCRLLESINVLPLDNLQKLQEGLRERGLTEEFLLQLRTRWSDLPQLPTVSAVLLVSQNYCSSCRLVAWDILLSLGAADLAQCLEG